MKYKILTIFFLSFDKQGKGGSLESKGHQMDNIEAGELEIPEDFDFPFPPYDIQKEFMQKLYFVLENKKLGIFESPTGTGKSLSIICGSIKWLKDRQNLIKQRLSDKMSELTNEKQEIKHESEDWLTVQSKEIEITRKIEMLKIEQNKIESYEKKIQNIKNAKEKKLMRKYKNTKQASEVVKPKDNLDDDKNVEDEDFLPKETEDDEDEENDDDTENNYEPIKIYICSRTHSQLAQLLQEIIKSPFGENVRVTTLASRQTYCINPKVTSLKSISLINERCLDLQKKPCCDTKKDEDGKVLKKKKNREKETSCPYYRQTAIEELGDQILMQILDIEDLVTFGREHEACPYYSTRKASEDAEIILIPYNTLLHKATREANGIKLKNNVVIIDEAHNLMEALAQMHNIELYYNQVYHSLLQLKAYKKRFNTKFSARSLLFINQILYILTQLEKIFSENVSCGGNEIFTLQNFVLTAKIDNYNMFKIVEFCKESRIAQKIRSYAIKYPPSEEEFKKTEKRGIKDFLSTLKPKNTNNVEETTVEKKPTVVVPPASNPFMTVVSFLETFTYSYEDGRILFKKNVDKIKSKLQFLLLNPTSNFKDVVKEARAVIVAGGTMKPISEFRNRLFTNSGADPSRIVEFSCDHIVPPENILPIIITKGPKNESLLFNFENRMNMGPNLKNIILQSCKTIKGGIIIFFPSYNYENWMWQQMKDFNFGRAVFREPQDSSSVDSTLEKYAAAVKKPNSNGALLFSVVGGKLSEGLNFSDDLGRCVIVVGLPYANITAADLKEKMNYLDKKEGLGSGQKFYENQCMKAVNQCIGRAVRHKNDYATVLLLDERFNRISIKNSLPNWIKKSLKVCTHNEAFAQIEKFFKEK